VSVSRVRGIPSRPSYSRRSSGLGEKIVGLGATIFLAIGAVLLFAAAFTYPVMLAFGIFHSYFNRVPALGFFATFAVVFAVRTLIQNNNGATVKKD